MQIFGVMYKSPFSFEIILVYHTLYVFVLVIVEFLDPINLDFQSRSTLLCHVANLAFIQDLYLTMRAPPKSTALACEITEIKSNQGFHNGTNLWILFPPPPSILSFIPGLVRVGLNLELTIMYDVEESRSC